MTAFFGLQAMLYFAITSWLAVYLVSRGLAPADAAALLAWFSLAGLPASLLAPVLAGRPGILRIMAPGLGLSVAAALLGVLMAPVELQFVMVGILGVVQSAGFGLAMALVVIRSDGPQSAGRLSAMSQGFGFALASLGPLGAGLLHTMTGGWEVTFWVLAAEAVVLAGAGFFAIRGPLVSVEAAERRRRRGKQRRLSKQLPKPRSFHNPAIRGRASEQRCVRFPRNRGRACSGSNPAAYPRPYDQLSSNRYQSAGNASY